jgi:hypothetical protein
MSGRGAWNVGIRTNESVGLKFWANVFTTLRDVLIHDRKGTGEQRIFDPEWAYPRVDAIDPKKYQWECTDIRI